jgi:transcriptional regulator with XRE-family HTH domain
MIIFPDRLKELRIANKVSQDTLAKVLNVTQRQISYYESGKDIPPLPALITIADYFNVSLDYLVGRGDKIN